MCKCRPGSRHNNGDHVREQIQEMRNSADDKFGKLFEIAQNLASQISEIIQRPRVAKAQRNRPNYDTETSEEYYRKAVFIPFLDYFISIMFIYIFIE